MNSMTLSKEDSTYKESSWILGQITWKKEKKAGKPLLGEINEYMQTT